MVERSGRARVAVAKPLTVSLTTPSPRPAATPAPVAAPVTAATLPPIAAAQPGAAHFVDFGPVSSNAVALTVDDGTCADCIGRIVEGIEKTGAHVTLCPNGTYASMWDPYAERIKAQIALGRVALCNHTFSHFDLTRLSDEQIRWQITTNEEWLQSTFGVTSRPYLRPPYGAFNSRVLAIAGELGYTTVAMWSGLVYDANTSPQPDVGAAMDVAATPGAIVLTHANRVKTAEGFAEMISVITGKGLRTMTLPEMFGT